MLAICRVLVLVPPVVLALSACQGGSPSGPNPGPTATPAPAVSTLVISGVLPRSGSVVCTGNGVVPLEVEVTSNLVGDYPPLSLYVSVALSNDGVNPIPFTMTTASSSSLRQSWSLRFTPGDRNVISSQWVLARYEYRPNGISSKDGMILLAHDEKPWVLTFNWGC